MKDWMIGKNPLEVAAIAQSLVDSATYAAPPRPAAPAPSYQPPPNVPQRPTQEEWMQDPYLASQKEQAWVQATQINPAVQQASGMIAQTNREMARLRFQDDYRRWGPEIDTRLNGVSAEFMTPANIETVIQMVRGQHAEEISQEALEREIQKRMDGGALLRPGSAPAGAPSVPGTEVKIEDLPTEYKAWLTRINVTPAIIDEFLMKTEVNVRNVSLDQARKEWLEKAKKGDVLLDAPPSKTALDPLGGR